MSALPAPPPPPTNHLGIMGPRGCQCDDCVLERTRVDILNPYVNHLVRIAAHWAGGALIASILPWYMALVFGALLVCWLSFEGWRWKSMEIGQWRENGRIYPRRSP